MPHLTIDDGIRLYYEDTGTGTPLVPVGSALTLRGVQMRRPSMWDYIDDMRGITTPTLIVTGDEDDPCLEPALLMKRSIPGSGLLVLPRGGHAINLEEPDAFNRALGDFLHAVEVGRSK